MGLRGPKPKRGVVTHHKTVRVPDDRYAWIQSVATGMGNGATLVDVLVAVLDAAKAGDAPAMQAVALARELDVARQEMLRLARAASDMTEERDKALAQRMIWRARVQQIAEWTARYVPEARKSRFDFRGLVRPPTDEEIMAWMEAHHGRMAAKVVENVA